MIGPDLTFERAARARGASRVCGVDEAGRGPLAGPVVAAAVVLGPAVPQGLNDSKTLSAHARERLFGEILQTADVSWASAGAGSVDAVNVRAASLLAMGRAVAGLATPADHALIDGNALPPALPCTAEAIVRGDGRSSSIAAASIVAKVMRDRMMVRAGSLWPAYGFAAHKGYPTAAHREAIALNGPCPLHRLTFAPLRGA